MWWNPLDDQDLMRLRLRDLRLTLHNSRVSIQLYLLSTELARKSIRWTPSIWISDEWCCPDGCSGFTIPFYLLHDRLLTLEITFGESPIEGEDPEEFMQLLRHETGHAILNAFHLSDAKMWKRLFGDPNKPYRSERYKVVPDSLDFVVNLRDNYGQAHPHEDWAETFAVWLDPDSDWQNKYKDWGCYRKLLYVDKIMNTLRYHDDVEVASATFKRPNDINRMTRTLGQFYGVEPSGNSR